MKLARRLSVVIVLGVVVITPNRPPLTTAPYEWPARPTIDCTPTLEHGLDRCS